MTLPFVLPAFHSALGLAWAGSAGPLAQEAAEQGIPWWMWLLIILALLAFAYVFYRWWRGSREEEHEAAAAHAVVPEKLAQAGPLAAAAAVERTQPEVQVRLPAVEPAEPAAQVEAALPAIELEEPAAEVEAALPAVELAEPALEMAALAPAAPDDLTLLEGIGPKIAGILGAAGVTTFAQLADLDVTRIKEILERANPKLLRLADPTTWPQQARLAAAGQHEALQELQSQLKGGRQR